MINSGQAGYYSLKQLFGGKGQVSLSIPDYQRGYAWGETQVGDLLSDIDQSMNSNISHYTGTVVVVDNGNARLDIVDGQQRLTTILLIIKALLDSGLPEAANDRSKYLWRGEVGNEVPVLEANREMKDFYREFIVKSNAKANPEYRSHYAVLQAFDQIKEWLLNSKDLSDVYHTVTEKLKFVVFAPESSAEAGLMFEVINNRGKRLSELEKIKNFFVYFATIHNKKALKDEVSDAWSKILRYLTIADKVEPSDEDTFLRYAYILFFEPNKERSWHVYKNLKQMMSVHDDHTVNQSTKTIQGFLECLVDIAKAYAVFYSPGLLKTESQVLENSDVEKYIEFLHCHPVNSSIFPLFLAGMTKKNISAPDLADYLHLLEKVNFRVYVLPKITSRSDSRQGHLYMLANEFFNNKKNLPELRNELVSFVKELCSIKKFVQHLTLDDDELAEDYMDWQGLRYFLARYENRLSGKYGRNYDVTKIIKSIRSPDVGTGDYLSREHVWAKANREKFFPQNHMQKRRLGNFVLLPLRENIRQSNADISEKVEMMRKDPGAVNLLQVEELAHSSQQVETLLQGNRKTKNYYLRYSMHLNDLRETKLIKFALEEWRVDDQESQQICKFDLIDSFTTKNRNEHYVWN